MNRALLDHHDIVQGRRCFGFVFGEAKRKIISFGILNSGNIYFIILVMGIFFPVLSSCRCNSQQNRITSIGIIIPFIECVVRVGLCYISGYALFSLLF